MELRIVDGVWNAEEIKLELRWTNNTGFDVLYGESYSVERERDGQWESCVMGDNLAFHLIGYDLKTGTAQKKTYNLTDIFDISENGKYRFITDCNVYHKGRGGESAKCNLWVEFTVTRVGDTSGDVRKRPVRFTPQYIRTDGHRENAGYPVVKVIRSVVPEAGTCDMAQWHILIEPEKGLHVESEADVALSINGTGMCNLP